MKLNIIFALFFLLPGMVSPAGLPIAKTRPVQDGRDGQNFDKSTFYTIMASGDLDAVNGELALLATSSSPEKEAYEGALLMRKAGLLARPAEKLRSFKAGRIQLESALLKDNANGEYHFLRLIIQEHAPGIVHYSKDLEEDNHIVHQTFKKLTPSVQKAIIDYSKKSKTLDPEDFDPKKN